MKKWLSVFAFVGLVLFSSVLTRAAEFKEITVDSHRLPPERIRE